jgi:hypothetical protein
MAIQISGAVSGASSVYLDSRTAQLLCELNRDGIQRGLRRVISNQQRELGGAFWVSVQAD